MDVLSIMERKGDNERISACCPRHNRKRDVKNRSRMSVDRLGRERRMM